MTPGPPSIVGTSSLGEVAWIDATGTPQAAGVLPLVQNGRPVLALTFDRLELAHALSAAPEVVLLVRESRNTGPQWQPAGWRCTSALTADPEGGRFVEQLLLQELRRYPPARRYADSPLLMREHWWYLPRLLVELEPLEDLPAPKPRSGDRDLLLVTERGGVPVVGGAVADQGRVEPSWGPRPGSGAGILHDQDATFPDLERWDTWTGSVSVADGVITSSAPLSPRPPVAMPGLLARWRAERRFGAQCRAGLRAWSA